MRAMTRSVGAAMSQCELTFVARSPVDLAVASKQHAAYCSALSRAGLIVTVLPPSDVLPDAVFVEDVAVVLDEIAVVTRPGTDDRRREVDSVAVELARYRPERRVEAPGTLEGGDILRVGRVLYAGISSRTNEEGVRQLRAAVSEFGYDVVCVPVSGCLHLKTAVTQVADGTLLINPRWIDGAPLSRMKWIEVPESEPFGGNCLLLGDDVYISSAHTNTIHKLSELGIRVHPLELSEFEKAEAGITCMSLLFE